MRGSYTLPVGGIPESVMVRAMKARRARSSRWLALACFAFAGVVAVLATVQCQMLGQPGHHGASSSTKGHTVHVEGMTAAANPSADQPMIMATIADCLRQIQEAIVPDRADLALRLGLLLTSTAATLIAALWLVAPLPRWRGPPGRQSHAGRALLMNLCINRC